MCNGDEMWNIKCRKHMAMRILIAIIVLIFVFWCGYQFGELHSYFRFFGPMMENWNGSNAVYGPGMMGGYGYW